MTDECTYTGPIWRKGKKTLLCPVQESDLPHFQKMVNTAEVQKSIIVDWPVNEIGQRKWFDKINTDPHLTTVTVRTLDGTIIGNMQMEFDEKRRIAKTGSLIGLDEHRGKGYGTDAKMTLLDYAFHWRDMRKVTSHIIGYNIRSRRYAKKCGYRFTARIPGEHFRLGKWRSEVIYTCWREEWIELWKRYNDVP